MSYTFARRSFLQSIGAAVGLASFLRGMERAEAQGPTPPQRVVFLQRPVGTVPQNWFPAADAVDPLDSRILRQFAALKDRMVLFDDIRLPFDGSLGGGHERGTVLMLTGKRTTRIYPGNGGDDPIAEGPSIDQLLVKGSPALQGTAIESLQLAADNRADTPEISTRNMSYAGAEAPLRPYYQPSDAYQRLFGTLMPGGATPGNLATLERARRKKKSVLDFALKDLGRIKALAPASQLQRLEMHTNAVREVESEFDAVPLDPTRCGVSEEPAAISVSTRLDSYSGTHVVPQRDDVTHSQIGLLHLALVKAAFACDLTRVATFQWAPGGNHVSFGELWPPDPTSLKVHHTTSHDPTTDDQREFLTRVEEFYALRAANFLQELATTPELTGSGALLDNTLVSYISEVAEKNHSWTRMPWLLFGGLGLIGGQRWESIATAFRSSNDLWMAVAERFGMQGFTLGDSDQHTTAIPGLFTT